MRHNNFTSDDEMLETIIGLGIVPGIIAPLIGSIFAGYFWLPRNGKPSRVAESVAGLLAQTS